MDVWEMLDNSRFGAHQWAIVALCAARLVMDGFDVQAMGYVAPVAIREWGIAKETLSPGFGAGLFGMLIGSLVFSALADKIGRRPVLIGATLFFSVCVIAAGFAQSIAQRIGGRFAAGLGLGCIMPNAMALAGEYGPRRIRVSLMRIVSCGRERLTRSLRQVSRRPGHGAGRGCDVDALAGRERLATNGGRDGRTSR
ncbi:sugar (and other) transporter family protein [Burkholderia oklahomensis C6786]|nr:sugar (and other) transporter family protein [Burkholderia oklahomensis C6786]